MRKPTIIEEAYGLLWLAATTDVRIHEARKRLLSLLDRDSKMRGVQSAMQIIGKIEAGSIEQPGNGTPSPSSHVAVTDEMVDDWLENACGVGIPFKDATDLPTMLHGLAYTLRQIEATNSYKVHIGQTGPATSSLRMALRHFGREALVSALTTTEGSTDA